ncbi:MAG: TolC family protein [Prevotellaceae bacterium]|jgi:outer membrane protein TolC|nr:TolC family protein [Prevotellaceae bacterium]
MINKRIICIVFSLTTSLVLHAQSVKLLSLTVEEAIGLARRQSPSVVSAKHSFHVAYWNYCYFRANYLPSVNFSSTPNLNRQINAITMPDGTSQFVQQNQFMVDGNISIDQNIALTGGSISLSTGLNRLDLFGTVNTHSYRTNPVSITFRQSLNGYNSLRWDRKTEPLRFEIAKKNYVIALENVSRSVISRFFSLAMAQTNLNIALTNYQSADTLYAFAEGRYKIGRITESEMLQIEVKRLNEETNLMNARMSLEDNIQAFRIFLGIKDTVTIEAITEKTVPDLHIDPYKALDLAITNNPTILEMEYREIESKRSVASTKANTGFQMDLYAQFGLSKAGSELHSAYKDLANQQYAQIGVRVPILDWGRTKGRIKISESSRQLTEIQLEQDRINFEQGILKLVRQFNMQTNQIRIAEKTDYTANKRNDVTQRLYVLGRSTIIELNDAITEKDNAKRNYLNTLYNFWSNYYEIRSLTLYNFEKNIPLTEDYESLLK